FSRLQLRSATRYSLGHRGNDPQKTIGILWMLLIASGYSSAASDAPPAWLIGACYLTKGLGTLFGGWRILRTMGQKNT
ncbi:inorganic phosphate transporter, partial [Burkholderia pseudomallei]